MEWMRSDQLEEALPDLRREARLLREQAVQAEAKATAIEQVIASIERLREPATPKLPSSTTRARALMVGP